MRCKHSGLVGAFSTKIGDTTLACVGLTESRAKAEGIDYVIGQAEAVDKHPGVLAGTKKIKLKLLVLRIPQEIIGGQVAGGSTIAEFINMLSTLIIHRVKIIDIPALQIATYPWLTPSPITYTLHATALDAYLKARK